MSRPREPSLEEIRKAVAQAIPIIEGKEDGAEFEGLPPIYREKMGKDLYDAALMDQREAGWTLGMYFALQDARIAAQLQRKSRAPDQPPNRMLETAYRMVGQLERNLQSALFVYAQSRLVGRWMMSLPGVGHVLAAGFLAYIDITKVHSVSQIWRFAGLDPTIIWYSRDKATEIVGKLIVEYGGVGAVTNEKGVVNPEFIARLCQKTRRKPDRLVKLALLGQKEKVVRLETLIKSLSHRPWNAKLKTHCWKLGQCLHLNRNNPANIYGLFMAQRRTSENTRNAAGEFASQAAGALEDYNYSRGTAAHVKYSKGILPDGHLHSRAKRFGVKLFLSHLFQVMYEDHHGRKPENPWVFEYGPEGHCHLIQPPNWPLK